MNLIPLVGTADIPFGTSESDILQRLGPPTTTQSLSEVDGYPSSRRVLNYAQCGFLVTPELGTIAVTAVASEKSTICLWGTDISKMSPDELGDYLRAAGQTVVIKRDSQWDDVDVEALDCGVIASFCEGTFESIDIHDPSWRQYLGSA